MVQVIYSKESGLKQQSGTALFEIPDDVGIYHPLSQTVTGNSVATLDFDTLVHAAVPAQEDQINLNGKYLQFKTAKSDLFYAWFNINGGSQDPQLDGTGIEINVANDADIDAPGDIATQLSTILNNNVDFNAEFFATKVDNTVKICALRMGNSGDIVSDISTLSLIQDGVGNTVSVGLDYSHGEGSYIVTSTGVSKVGSANILANQLSFVVLQDLTKDMHHGVRKIILSDHPEDVEIKKSSEQGDPLGTFDAVGDTLHVLWNGTSWKTLYN